MHKELTFQNQTISYSFRRSTRAHRMRLAVKRDGSVQLTMPARATMWSAENFVQRQRQWIMDKLAFFRTLPPLDPIARYGRREYLKYKEQARALVMQKLDEFAPRLGVSYGTVRIKDQKTCWGSCSPKGNLNFNYKLLFLPSHLQDYVIVHELAHIRELSHSRRFWNVVAEIIPDYIARRRELHGMKML
jgi:predicted metal-dependent hydrolase